MDMEQEELMMLVPPLFSLKDIPEETVLRPSDFTNKKTKKQTVDGSLQMGNTAPCFGLDFKIKDIQTKLLSAMLLRVQTFFPVHFLSSGFRVLSLFHAWALSFIRLGQQFLVSILCSM